MSPVPGQPKVVVVGSSNTDLVVRVPNLPGPGETVLGLSFAKNAGGKGANQAVAAARAGAQVTFIGCVGDDEFGRKALAGLARDGIDVTHVRIDQEAPSGVALIAVDESGENSISVAAGANSCLLPEHLDEARDAFSGVDVVLLQLEVPVEAVVRAAQLGRAAGAHVILNPAPARPLPSDLFKCVSTIVPNETETEGLTGILPQSRSDAEAAAEKLVAQGVERVVLTLGDRGALLVAPGIVERVPALCVQAVDTTAAGDAFCGALAASPELGDSAPLAVAFACAAAACAVTRQGAQPSMPYLEEIQKKTN
jgi:ribokinase